MARETTNRRRRKRSAEIQRRNAIALGILLLVLIVIIVGIVAVELFNRKEDVDEGLSFESSTSVVFILKDGTIVSNDVIAFDTGKYNQNELGVFIQETISTYNEENGEDAVVQQSLNVENNIASLILEYTNADIYEDFAGTELFTGSIAEAVAAGYDFDGQFASIVEGKAVECSKEDFYGQTELKVAVIKANTKIQVEGEIMYLSTENVAECGDNWIVTKDGSNLLSSNNASDSETGDTEPDGSETETSDGSVDATELVTEEEETSTEIIFDFGDTELPPAEDETYSEVYTYIIYK